MRAISCLLAVVLLAGVALSCSRSSGAAGNADIATADSLALTASLSAAEAWRDGETIVLYTTRPFAVRLEFSPPDANRRSAREIARPLWSLEVDCDATGEAVLRRYNALRPATLRGDSDPMERLFDPGTRGGRCEITVVAQQPAGAATARLVVIAPLVLPNKNRYAAAEELGLGRYLNPADPKDLALAKKMRGGVDVNYPAKNPPLYQPPALLYRCTPQTRSVRICESLTLGEMAVDFPWFSLGLPQYVAFSRNIARKTDDLVRRLREHGHAQKGIKLIYGFRPPIFNLGRIEADGPGKTLKEPFSPHQYGWAVDLIVDDDDDLQLDDLNGDGTVDIFDAAVILYHVNAIDKDYRAAGDSAVGGAGIYYHHDFWERPVQSPYCHIDTRGYLRADKTLLRWASPRSTWPDGTVIRFSRIDQRGYPIP